MKPTIKPLLRGFVLLLSGLLFFNSCTVYHGTSYSIDSAIQNEEKVKVIGKNGETYYFNFIEKDGDNLIGYTKSNSNTAKRLQDDIIKTEGELVGVAINEKETTEIRAKNKSATTWANVGLGALVATSAVFFSLMSSQMKGN